MRYARLSFFVFESSIFLFRKVKLWYTKVQKRQKQISLMTTAEQQDIVTKTAMESIIKLLIIVELDRGEKQRLYISQSIKDGIAASNKKSGRKPGQLDKMSDALREDILKYLSDRSIKQVDLMRKYNISRNTLKKYVYKIQNHNII